MLEQKLKKKIIKIIIILRVYIIFHKEKSSGIQEKNPHPVILKYTGCWS